MERESALLAGLSTGGYAYFVHSYALPVGPATAATTVYGAPFSACVQWNNFYGVQFHPERSAALGARVLQNFLDIR
jgi:glutamine amidotransferase